MENKCTGNEGQEKNECRNRQIPDEELKKVVAGGGFECEYCHDGDWVKPTDGTDIETEIKDGQTYQYKYCIRCRRRVAERGPSDTEWKHAKN